MKKKTLKSLLKNEFYYLFLILFSFADITNLFAQWEECNNGIARNPINCFIIDGNNTYAGIKGGIFMTTDNGNKWTAKNNGLKGSIIGLYVQSLAISGDNIFAGTGADGIFLSTDKGEHWVQKSNGLPFYVFGNDTIYNTIEEMTIKGNYIFAGIGSGAGIYLSTDNGAHWRAKNNGLPIFDSLKKYICSMTVCGNNIFAGTGYGVFMSSDNGDSWYPKNKGMENMDVYSFAINGNNIYAGAQYGIYLSTNNGDDWKNIGLEDNRVTGIAIKGNNIFAAPLGVSLSTDNGNSWYAKNSGLTDLGTTSIIINDDYIFVGTDNSGIFRAKLSDLGITDIKEDKQTLAHLIYPNPASDFVKIRMKEQPSGNVQIRIVDLFGRTVYNSFEINSEQFNEKTIDCSNFPNGFYSAVVTYNNKNEWLPFVISK